MTRSWAWGIVGTLLVAWLLGISAKVMALSEDTAVTSVILPRIEKKIDDLSCYLKRETCR